MITDAFLRLSDAQALTTTAVSTNTIDLGVARDMGAGEELYVYFTVPTALAGGTSVTFQVITSAAAALTSPTIVGSTNAIVTASLVAGYKTAVRINPSIFANGQRYLGAQYTIVGTYTSGNVTCDIAADIADFKTYASGFSVT
jgi:hypothetical protein